MFTPEGEVLFQWSEPLVDGIDKLLERFAAHFGRMVSGGWEVIRRCVSLCMGISIVTDI